MIAAEKYSFLFIDLDNTLIDENEYLFSAYRQIGLWFEKKCIADAELIADYLKQQFIVNGRSNLFDNLLKVFKLEDSVKTEWLKILRTQTLSKPLSLNSVLSRCLNDRFSRCKFAVITNGNPEQQKNKIAQTDWTSLKLVSLPPILTDLTERKPSAKSLFTFFNENPEFNLNEILLIGDSEVDEKCAAAAGIDFVEVSIINKIWLETYAQKKILS